VSSFLLPNISYLPSVGPTIQSSIFFSIVSYSLYSFAALKETRLNATYVHTTTPLISAMFLLFIKWKLTRLSQDLHPEGSKNKNCGIGHTREGIRQLHKMSSDQTLRSTPGVISISHLAVCRLFLSPQHITFVIFHFPPAMLQCVLSSLCTEFLLCKSFITTFLSVIHWPTNMGDFRYLKLFLVPSITMYYCEYFYIYS
jgi:hypothetical protein